jgi:hypothetical protein
MCGRIFCSVTFCIPLSDDREKQQMNHAYYNNTHLYRATHIPVTRIPATLNFRYSEHRQSVPPARRRSL